MCQGKIRTYDDTTFLQGDIPLCHYVLLDDTKISNKKLSQEFLDKCNMILDEININPTLHTDLIYLAKKVTHTGPEEGGNQKMGAFADRLMAEFPGINAWEDQYINTGISIPFYGKSKIGFNNSGTNGRFYTIAGYVVDKLQKKYNKYE